MDPVKLAELEGAATAAATAAEGAGGTDASLNLAAEEARKAFETAKEPSQDHVKSELERVQRKEPKTETEKAAYALKKNAERAKELGLDPAAILGVTSPAETADDAAPVTIGMLKKIEADKAAKTALQLADEIPNEHERELTKHYLQTRIVPSGNPQDDLRTALAIVNSVKNGQIAEELGRRGAASAHTGGGAPAKPAAGEFVPTAEEAQYMRPPWNMTKEDILKTRKS